MQGGTEEWAPQAIQVIKEAEQQLQVSGRRRRRSKICLINI